MTTNEKALLLHREWQGKLETVSKAKVATREDLALAYTPGVAEPCRVIAGDKDEAYNYTWKSNTIAVVSDGSAVLGLGNIGPYAAMPVMEGKAVLFKEFGGVNAFPICLDTQDTEEIIETVVRIAPAFGGINLEDISAPRCFEIEERLKERLHIPVFHDDQHGTAIVVLAGIINALKVVGKKKEDCRVVVNGAGSAGHLKQAPAQIRQNYRRCQSQGSGEHRLGGGENGRKSHDRQGYIGDIVEEGADSGIFDLLSDQSQGQSPDAVGDSGHNQYVDPGISFHDRPPSVLLLRETAGPRPRR